MKEVYYTRQPRNQSELEKLKISILREKHTFFVTTVIGILIGIVMFFIASPLMGGMVFAVVEALIAIPGFFRWRSAKRRLSERE